jgi:hypothetical protein
MKTLEYLSTEMALYVLAYKMRRSIWRWQIDGSDPIFTEWGKLEDKQARVRLVWTQAIHWIAVLVARSGCGDEENLAR